MSCTRNQKSHIKKGEEVRKPPSCPWQPDSRIKEKRCKKKGKKRLDLSFNSCPFRLRLKRPNRRRYVEEHRVRPLQASGRGRVRREQICGRGGRRRKSAGSWRGRGGLPYQTISFTWLASRMRAYTFCQGKRPRQVCVYSGLLRHICIFPLYVFCWWMGVLQVGQLLSRLAWQSHSRDICPKTEQSFTNCNVFKYSCSFYVFQLSKMSIAKEVWLVLETCLLFDTAIPLIQQLDWGRSWRGFCCVWRKSGASWAFVFVSHRPYKAWQCSTSSLNKMVTSHLMSQWRRIKG